MTPEVPSNDISMCGGHFRVKTLFLFTKDTQNRVFLVPVGAPASWGTVSCFLSHSPHGLSITVVEVLLDVQRCKVLALKTFYFFRNFLISYRYPVDTKFWLPTSILMINFKIKSSTRVLPPLSCFSLCSYAHRRPQRMRFTKKRGQKFRPSRRKYSHFFQKPSSPRTPVENLSFLTGCRRGRNTHNAF